MKSAQLYVANAVNLNKTADLQNANKKLTEATDNKSGNVEPSIKNAAQATADLI